MVLGNKTHLFAVMAKPEIKGPKAGPQYMAADQAARLYGM